MNRPVLVTLLAAAFLLTTLPDVPKAAERFTELVRRAESSYYAGDFARARDIGERALERGRKEHGGTAVALFDIYSVLAGTTMRQRDFVAAEQYVNALLDVVEAHYGGREGINAAFALEPLAHIYAETGRLDEADGLFRKISTIRRIMVIDGTDPFAARHKANFARIALKRRRWKQAFDGFSETIQLIAGGKKQQFDNQDQLYDLSSETNSWTFAGLAEAAWELERKTGRKDRRYIDAAFQAMQWKWRTSAAAALLSASVRAYEDDPKRSKRERELQDLRTKLEAVEQELLALHETIARKTEATPAHQKRMDANRQVDPTELMRISQRLVTVMNELTALYGKCGMNCGPPARKLEAEQKALEQRLAEASAPATAIDRSPSPEEAEIERKYGPERVRLYEKQGALRERLRRMERHFKHDYPDKRAGKNTKPSPFLEEPKPISLAETQGLLDRDAALVAFLVGSDKVFVWAVARDAAAWAPVALDRARLGEMIADLRTGLNLPGTTRGAVPLVQEGVSPASGAAWLDTAYELYARLLGPVESLIKNKKTLLVVPSGPLTSFPFHAFVTERSDGAANDDAAYRDAAWLTRRHAIAVLPSVASLRALSEFTPSGKARKAFKGFGDPVLGGKRSAPQDESAPRGLSSFFRNGKADPEALQRLAPLPDTANELRAVARSLGAPESDILLGREATERAVKRARLADYRVVHFATHGLVAGELRGLVEPALVMTPPSRPGKNDDGLLTASEVAALKLNADWVVLSACNTAAGRDGGAEALSGLARAFFYAGARALLVSHWPVYSDAAVTLTTTAFTALRKDPRIGRAEALRRAMLKMIDQGKPGDARPARWAPFVLVGDDGHQVR